MGEERDRGSYREKVNETWLLFALLFPTIVFVFLTGKYQVKLYKMPWRLFSRFAKHSMYGGFATEMRFGCLHLNCAHFYVEMLHKPHFAFQNIRLSINQYQLTDG